MEWAWLIPALSFIAFPLVIIFGRWLPLKGALISVAAIAAGFALFWVVAAGRIGAGVTDTDVFRIEWFQAGGITANWGMIVDPLSVMMLGLVSLVALCVQVYSLGYMKGDPRFGWYFAAHSLFAASMLTLVLADNLLLLYIAWELVGLCSYLLIGFYFERRSAAEAAKKAFVTTRIGDVGLLIGVLLLWKTVGTFDIPTILQQAEFLLHGEPSLLTTTTATWAAVLLFMGAMGKSAQFPLHVWLPDAMEGPSPVSALIHAATMVVAGVFLVGRMFGLFEAAPLSLLIVASIGMVTVIVSGLIGLVVTDLKRILAYSTINDLGLMMLSLGAWGFTAGLFHMLTHGFSKAMLFLGAGNVMHGTGGKVDIREMGGLRRVMPFTAATFAIGALSLAGIPIFAGFWSKDEIVGSVFHGHLYGAQAIFFILLMVMVFIKALFMARAYFVPFTGKLSEENQHHAHEAPLSMRVPMALLAFLAVTAGFLAIGWGGGYQGFGSFLFHDKPHAFEFNWALAALSTVVALAGVVLGWMFYYQHSLSSQRMMERFPAVHKFLNNKMYLDDLYQWVIDHVALVLGRFIAVFDRAIINDVGVNGTADSVKLSADRLRYHITGRVYNYALGVAVGAVAVAIAWWILGTRV